MNKKSNSVATVTWLADWRRSRGTSSVHSQQIISGQVVPFPSQGRNKPGPRRRRNAPPLPPLADRPVTLSEVIGHFSEGKPAVEYGAKVLHDPYLARDGLSRQGVTRFPVPSKKGSSENTPMGRARSPVQFNKNFALKLKSARIAAGYSRAEDFARDLGVTWERYKKWESGRTPIQHEYLPRACELTGKDANYFYDLGEQRKAG